MIGKMLDLFFPPRCVTCKCSGSVLCLQCLAKVRRAHPPLCPFCGSQLPLAGPCRRCRVYRPALTGLRAVGSYQEPLRTWIHELKYEGNTRLAVPLGMQLACLCASSALRADLFIPVPLHPHRQHQRGYNHASLLARECARLLATPVREDILLRSRATAAQVGLSAQERLPNVQGAFHCHPHFINGVLQDHTIFLVDDVCTTGATLEACAAPLFMAGATAIWGLVLAFA